jgi:signal transduction histidine kinase
MEPTDLNAKIREFSNLAFHGMRAGNKAINVEINLNLDEKIGEIPLYADDFNRVILNLCNNAFDAMREKGEEPSAKSSGYKPLLTISSKKLENGIGLIFEDNGPGIPDDIKDKILQPFFTTKKGTEGTGLGLSITHDIIKRHNGTLEIYSKEGEQTQFIIFLPTLN